METNFTQIFKAYDVRGLYPSQVNEKATARIAEAYIAVKKPSKIAVGCDVRNSGKNLKESLISTLLKYGVDVIDIGVITTDQLYFSVGNYKLDGGISVTASHNPGEYNGFKFADSGGAPLTSEDLERMRDFASSNQVLERAKEAGKKEIKEIIDDYIDHVSNYVSSPIKPMKIVVNANFGAVGRVVDILAKKYNLELERLNWEQDGSFPKGPPNPLLPSNRDETIAIINKSKPDLGVAWDADADRCFFFTGDGTFVDSCYIIPLLAGEILKDNPGASIVHDVTTKFVIEDGIMEAGGLPIMNRTGHTFIKARMRQVDAPFAGESSGHYYFRDSYYADNGIAPFLMILGIMSRTKKSLTELVEPLMSSYFVSGEINFPVKNTRATLEALKSHFGAQGKTDTMDGIAIETKQWRISVRPSNTEPLIRLNVETRSKANLDKLIREATEIIKR